MAIYVFLLVVQYFRFGPFAHIKKPIKNHPNGAVIHHRTFPYCLTLPPHQNRAAPHKSSFIWVALLELIIIYWMDKAFKKRITRVESINSSSLILSFKVRRIIPFGKAVYVCGNISELGLWNPINSLRLSWTQNNEWVGTVQLQRIQNEAIQFKFITSDWQILQKSIIEWECGKTNRTIELSQVKSKSTYNAIWNRQEIVLCLHVSHEEENDDRYFATGSPEQLGNWTDRKQLHPITKDIKDSLNIFFKTDPQFLCEINLSTLHTYAFNVSLDLDRIYYTFIRQGETCERQVYIGRTISREKEADAKGRIKEIDWTGCKYIIDEPVFSSIALERLNHHLYMATNLKNFIHLQRIEERHITAIFNINSLDEDYTISNYHLSALCKQKNIYFEQWIVQELASNTFVGEAEKIMTNLEGLLVMGHRVCIHCSKKLIKSAPIQVLYFTLVEGYPFAQAIELVKRQASISQIHCKIAKDVFFIVSNKIGRGKMQIKSH